MMGQGKTISGETLQEMSQKKDEIVERYSTIFSSHLLKKDEIIKLLNSMLNDLHKADMGVLLRKEG